MEMPGTAQNTFRKPLEFPHRMTKEQLFPCAYYYMFLSRKFEERIIELYRKGLVKGTVTLSSGGEASSVGMALPLRHGRDVVAFMHRNFAAHLIAGMSPYTLLCQYLANADSPTHGREGNVHHGDVRVRRFPMMSHLGSMLSPVVGGVWAARSAGEDVMGLTVIGDGGSSTGDFHESLNLASVKNIPVLFLIENNGYSFSTPVKYQYRCENLSDRAVGYGIPGRTIDGTDVWEVYSAVMDALERMRETSLPYVLECRTLRMGGHAVYDTAEYITAQERASWPLRDPLTRARAQLAGICGLPEETIVEMEKTALDEIEAVVGPALKSPRPNPGTPPWEVFAPRRPETVEPFRAQNVKNLTAVNLALRYLLERNRGAFVAGLDVGPYGSAFKSCKGLHDSFGSDRVLDMPLCESAIVGFSLGAAQTGGRPIVEFQFADFSTEATTQLGLNCGTWYFRSGTPAPIVFRLPCGAGITLGAFHSGEFEGLWSRFPGLKILYPTTPQETFEALVAAFHDPNPCIVLEHKLLYWGQGGDIDFDGDLESVWLPRRYREGSDLTIVALGAMVRIALEAASPGGHSVEVWNPFILSPLIPDPIIESVKKTGRLLVVQESTSSAGLGDRFISLITRTCMRHLKEVPHLLSAPDVPVPFARELEEKYLPGLSDVRHAIEVAMGAKP